MLAKRGELFLKGGAFAITYKQLVLDLLTKRLSPSVITGLLINNCHKTKPNTQDTFLASLLKDDNQGAFVKCFTSSPHLLAT